MPEVKPDIETFAKIKVVGVGGSGGSAINRMIASKIRGVEFIAINTDVQALHNNNAKHKLHIGQATTRGLGAGMNPGVGLQAAQESINEIRDLLKGADMVFITCGLGGGTGTGASPVIAQVAKELGALVVAVVTKPFSFEGAQRSSIAEGGFEELKERVDTIITIPNDKVLQIIDKKTSLLDAFKTVDDVLRQGVQGISELITIPALVNLDFADVKTIMQGTGSALMGIGEASGENRAVAAAKIAISSPLLDISIDGAKGVLFIVVGGPSLTMNEVREAADVITESADANARIIFGVAIDEGMKDNVKITVIATGFGDYESKPIRASFAEPKYSMNRLFSKKTIESKIDEAKNEMTIHQEKTEVPKEEVPIAKPLISKTRRLEGTTNVGGVNSGINNSEEEEDLEIPTFLRKKMK